MRGRDFPYHRHSGSHPPPRSYRTDAGRHLHRHRRRGRAGRYGFAVFETSWVNGLKARGTDIVVSDMASSLTPKPFDASAADRIRNLPDLAATCRILFDLTSVRAPR